MSFWDTVLGHNLAEVLCRTLPKIANALEHKSKTQKVVQINVSEVYDYLQKEIAENRKLVDSIPLTTNPVQYIIITE